MAQDSKNKGIDIAVAMEILAQRSQQQQQRQPHHWHNNGHNDVAIAGTLRNNGTAEDNKCPCTRHSHTNNMPMAGGQVIDLSGGNNPPTQNPNTTPANNDPQQQALPENPAQSALQTAISSEHQQEQQDKLKKEISNMSLKERIKLVLQAQEDRVATYRRFDQGLSEVLATGNITMYPALCAQVTAIFAVLSNTINAVRDQNDAKNKELKPLLAQLQNQESQKLNFTAALHMDQMREATLTAAATANDTTNNQDLTSTLEMLQSGIQSLRQKITKCVEEINQVLEELQCLLMEEDWQ